jgi:hypothetical protein
VHFVTLPFILFLNSVAVHMPLAQAGCPMALLVARVLTALSAWPLAYLSFILFGAGLRTSLMVLLALHCSVTDWAPGDWRSRAHNAVDAVDQEGPAPGQDEEAEGGVED